MSDLESNSLSSELALFCFSNFLFGTSHGSFHRVIWVSFLSQLLLQGLRTLVIPSVSFSSILKSVVCLPWLAVNYPFSHLTPALSSGEEGIRKDRNEKAHGLSQKQGDCLPATVVGKTASAWENQLNLLQIKIYI